MLTTYDVAWPAFWMAVFLVLYLCIEPPHVAISETNATATTTRERTMNPDLSMFPLHFLLELSELGKAKVKADQDAAAHRLAQDNALASEKALEAKKGVLPRILEWAKPGAVAVAPSPILPANPAATDAGPTIKATDSSIEISLPSAH
jgi:hypothetical protein